MMGGVLVKRNRIFNLRRPGRELDGDAQRRELGHEVAVEGRYRPCGQRQPCQCARRRQDFDLVIDEIGLDLERHVARPHWRRGQPACGDVQRHVRPLRLKRREGQTELPDDLQLHVKRIQRVRPGLVGQFWPGLGDTGGRNGCGDLPTLDWE